MGPVLEAIDAGHFERTPEKKEPTLCRACREPWPCPDILAARKLQTQYAENLRLQSLVGSDTRKLYT